MPAYNAESFIGESIQSILDQSFKDFIFLIIDDASEDKTVDIILKFQQKDSRIQLLKNEKNLGVAGTLNRGLQIIKTPFIARMDSDDISHPQRLEKQFNFLKINPEVDICGSYIGFLDSKKESWKMPLINNEIKAALLWDNNFAHPSIIIRTEIFTKTGKNYPDIFKNPSLEDYHLWMELLPFANFANIPEVLVSKRIHKESVTQQHEDNGIRVLQDFFRLIFSEYGLNISDYELSLHLLNKSEKKQNLSAEKLKDFINWQVKLKSHFSRFDFMESKAIEAVNQKKWKMLMDKIPFYNFPLLIDYLKLSENKPELFKLFLKKKVKKILSW